MNLGDLWSKTWPNLLASLLWVPVTMIHVTRSHKKNLKIYLGKKPGDDNEEGTE